ncbi:rhodanese-related sulfurtransferase, partial [Escherichia fergusonii]
MGIASLKAKMLAENEPRTTISFYKYFTIADPQTTRDTLYKLFTALNV